MSAPNKLQSAVLALASFVLLCGAAARAQLPMEGLQLKTLFTTPEERALIDRNRYRQEPRVRSAEPQPVVEQPSEPAPVPMVTVEKELMISGISISPDGTDVAWINGQMYEDGDRIDGDIRLRISARDGRLRLILPGGKTQSAAAGDRVVVSYRKKSSQ